MNDFYDFSDLRLGMRVNVEGSLQADGSLRALMISIKDDGDADEMEANLEGVDTAAGTLRVLGLTVTAGSDCEIKDIDKQSLTLAALRAGIRLKLKGRLGADRRFLASKIKVKMHSPDEQDEIEAAITTLDPVSRTLTVLGFSVSCDADVEIEA
jgi:hypothetical protein